ncbi:MAG: DUF624 domain-containing protein [Firmicutes bacterium]|nr:DUF624 domain-containing protein [Bacillota bacterium]
MTFKDVFSIEGPFARFGTALFDMIYTDFLWLILGGPAAILVVRALPVGESGFLLALVWILTIAAALHLGPGTSAAYAALGKLARKEDSYIFKDFWKSYQTNYKQGLIVTLILGVIGVVLFEAMWVTLEYLELFGFMFYIIFPIQCFAAAELVITIIYVYPLLARFDMTTKELLKNALLMANKHLPTSLLLLAMLAGTLYVPIGLNLGGVIVIFGIYFYLSAMLLERVFRNYMAPEDVLTPEESEMLGEKTREVTESDEEKAARAKERQEIIDKYTKKLNK